MNNERYNQIIDEAYDNYCNLWTERAPTHGGMGTQLKAPYEERVKWGKEVSVWRGNHGNGMMTWEDEPLSKEEFINRCKTDSKFSERWGLLIKETYNLISHTEDFGDVTITKPKRRNKLIIVYKNEIIEVYE